MEVILQLLCLYLPGGVGYIATPTSVFTEGWGGGYTATPVSVFTWGGGYIASSTSVFTVGGGGGDILQPMCLYLPGHLLQLQCLYLPGAGGGGGVYCNQCVCMTTWYVAPGVV